MGISVIAFSIAAVLLMEIIAEVSNHIPLFLFHCLRRIFCDSWVYISVCLCLITVTRCWEAKDHLRKLVIILVRKFNARIFVAL